MKEFIINNSMNFIIKNKHYSKKELEKIRYGFASIYLLISKFIIISSLAYFLNLFQELIIFITIYNLIRIPSFGLHASKTWVCLLTSTIIFILIPYLCTIIEIDDYIKLIICLTCIVLLFKNSPADTKKRPIVSIKRRKIYKIITTIIAITYTRLVFIIDNIFIINCLIFSLIIQAFITAPLAYKIFKLPYNNYESVRKEVSDD